MVFNDLKNKKHISERRHSGPMRWSVFQDCKAMLNSPHNARHQFCACFERHMFFSLV